MAACISRVFSYQLVAVQWKKPISPVANGWLERLSGEVQGGAGGGKRIKKKKGKNIKKKRKREEREGRKRGGKKKEGKITCDFLDSLTEHGKGSKHTPI